MPKKFSIANVKLAAKEAKLSDLSEYKRKILELAKKTEITKDILHNFKSHHFDFIFESVVNGNFFEITSYLVVSDIIKEQVNLEDFDDVEAEIRGVIKKTFLESHLAVRELQETIINSPTDHAKITSKLDSLPAIVPKMIKKSLEGKIDLMNEVYDIPLVSSAMIDIEIFRNSKLELTGISKIESFHIVCPGLYAVTMKLKLLNSNEKILKKCYISKALLLKYIEDIERFNKSLGNYTLEFDQLKQNYILIDFVLIQGELDFDDL